MISMLHLLCMVFLFPPDVKIGEVEKTYALDQKEIQVRGLTYDTQGPRLFVLDQSGKVLVYQVGDQLKPMESFALAPKNPRGLAFALEDNTPVLYFLSWSKKIPQLWRLDLQDQKSSCTDLSHHSFCIGDREVFDLTCFKGKILICYDASHYPSQNQRRMRGILQLSTDPEIRFEKHLPDSGEFVSRGLASMEMEGNFYLWGAIFNDYIYGAEGRTGRGLFYFKWPGESKTYGLCYGDGAIWAADKNRIHKINVTQNPDRRVEGPKILRRLIMTITTKPEKNMDRPGEAYHNYSRPYAYEQLGCQGTWLDTESIKDLSKASHAKISEFIYDPAKDPSARQHMKRVTYANAPARVYSSRYEIDLWTNRSRHFVYPHRVNQKQGALKGTEYLKDDPDLFNLKDKQTYSNFFDRVRDHIKKKYKVSPRMTHPYWAARNALEYIQDHYYYPNREKGKPAAVDYKQGHYDANPGNLKIKLTEQAYDKSQIIACSGTSVMLAGAMRHLGVPARWLGTGTQAGPSDWDKNNNQLLDEEEIASCSNGHRYSQVWLGENYGWTCFDATPSRPPLNDYHSPPPYQSQWRYMNRAAAGHMKNRRIVFNVGSLLFKPLYREFEFDEKLNKDNNCGGDQRYNLQGRFEKPQFWKLASHRIQLKNLCHIKNIKFSGPKHKTRVTWELMGPWERAPDSRLNLFLKGKKTVLLVNSLPYDAKVCVTDLSPYSGKGFCFILRKEGDPETGGQSLTFDLK